MKIARPPGGFRIVFEPAVAALINQFCGQSKTNGRYWSDIQDRLKFVAHEEGVPVQGPVPGCRLWIAAADPVRSLPRIALVYQALGATVRIVTARIS